jgi:hypothetical protein
VAVIDAADDGEIDEDIGVDAEVEEDL